jgi:hypothetical protein
MWWMIIFKADNNRTEIGFYDNPKAVGFVGWIKNNINVIFVRFDGTFTEPFTL